MSEIEMFVHNWCPGGIRPSRVYIRKEEMMVDSAILKRRACVAKVAEGTKVAGWRLNSYSQELTSGEVSRGGFFSKVVAFPTFIQPSGDSVRRNGMGSWKKGSLLVSLLPINFKLISETQGVLTRKYRKACARRQRVKRVSRESKTQKQELIGWRI